MTAETQRQRAGDWLGKGQLPETAVGIRLGQAALVAKAVEVTECFTLRVERG